MIVKKGGILFLTLVVLAGLSACDGGAVKIQPPGVIGDCGMAENGAGTGLVDYVMVYQSKLSQWCQLHNLS